MEHQSSEEQPLSFANDNEHMRVLSLLPEYVLAVTLGQPPLPMAQRVEAHLAACTACRAEADSLRQLLQAAYTEELALHARLQPPDLSFLPTPFNLARLQANPPHISGESSARAPIHLPFSAAFLAQIQVRGNVRAHSIRKRYEHTLPAGRAQDPHLRIEIFEHTDRPDLGQVRVVVEYPERNPFAQGRTQVRLQIGATVLAGATNQHGVILFTDVDLAQIDSWQLTVVPHEPGAPG